MNKQELILKLIEIHNKSIEWKEKKAEANRGLEQCKNAINLIAEKHSDYCQELNGKIVSTVSDDYYEIEYSEVGEPKIRLFFKEGVKLDEN